MFVWVVGVGCWCGLLVRVVSVGWKCSLMYSKCLDLHGIVPKEVINLLQKQFIVGVNVLVGRWCGLLVWVVGVGCWCRLLV